MGRSISLSAEIMIKEFEGLRLYSYKCAAGYCTIGYGHVLKGGEKYQQIDEEIADHLFKEDVQVAQQAVSRLIHVELKSHQYDALVSFTFNVGSAALQRSTLRRKVNRQEHEEVPREFLRWTWAGGRFSKGLGRRRWIEATLYESGQYLTKGYATPKNREGKIRTLLELF